MPPNNKRRAVSLVKTILQDILHSPSLDDFKDAPHSTLRALPAFDVRAPVPLAGPTSWQALVSDGKPQKDRRVCSSSAVAVARGGSTRHWVLSQKKRGQSGTLTNAASWTPKQIYNLLYRLARLLNVWASARACCAIVAFFVAFGVASAAAELLCWYSLVDMCPSRTTLSVLWGAFYLHQGLHVRLEWKSNGDRGKSFAVLTDKSHWSKRNFKNSFLTTPP
ncbi:hypothetical protein PF006_g18966 [Phytophthora fragariae]|uniref:Uncharacterized protein n=1 Tax=Phytophthora fragariae TaxID=53985 RepID=A0A6A3SMP2_9STRA|nr:hypothetical protein PF009_g20969 [Phytophthora fragariae]KAE9116766.1 hypothetical protein PF006_g18966 [Phytophthora fragariae]